MQVQIKKESQVFKPVTLEITFETQHEMDVFQHMCSYDVDIPNHVYPRDNESNLSLMRILGAIHDMIVKNQGD